MRYGVIADVHGNLQALRAAFACLEAHGVDRYLMAGDFVGYGANPNECIELVAGRDAVCVAGNHDLMALGRLSDDRCIPLARQSLRWTRSVLTQDSRAFLGALPLRASAPGGVVMAHGGLDDPERYVDRAAAAAAQLERLRADDPAAGVLILGHTHQPFAFGEGGGIRWPLRGVSLRRGERILLNPGAVGQSRGLRPWARFLLVDLDRSFATFLTSAYELDDCRAALRRAQLPVRSVHLRPSPPRLARRVARKLTDAGLAHVRARLPQALGSAGR